MQHGDHCQFDLAAPAADLREAHKPIGAMFAFMQYATQILFSLLMVALMFVMIPRAQAFANRINEILEMEPEITDAK